MWDAQGPDVAYGAPVFLDPNPTNPYAEHGLLERGVNVRFGLILIILIL